MSLFRRRAADSGATATAEPPESAYQRKRRLATASSRAKTHNVQEIGPIPPPADPARRAAALACFRTFLETYFRHRFPLAWSDDHLAYIADIQRAQDEGGLQATALPRGSGKTTIAECAMIWGALRGTVPFGVLIGSTKPAAEELLDSIRTEFETNDLLLADFPEACLPVRRLEGINQRRLLLAGRQLRIKIQKLQIILADVPGAACGGAIIRTAGLTGRIRGMKYARTDGGSVRPSFVILDDPQTDKSARSPKQCEQRAKLITGAVLGLAGPGKQIAVVMPCTIVRRGDLADDFLDRQKHPEWHGRKAGLMRSLPTNLDTWNQYWEIRSDELRRDEKPVAANKYYADNREAMDAGAVPSWPARHRRDELSAVQHFMNLFLADRLATLAEYQNDPEDETATAADALQADDIVRRTNGTPRGKLPTRCEYVSVGVDVQKALLYWSALGSEARINPFLVDYGSWPKQRTRLYSLRDATRTIQKEFPEADLPGQIYGALERLTADLVGRDWTREDGTRLRLGRIVIDARYEPDTIYKFAKQSPHRDIIVPAVGVAGSKLYMDKRPTDGTKHGPTGDYKLLPAGARPVRHIALDSARWISRVTSWLKTPIGSAGALTVFEGTRDDLRLFAEHCCAEYSTVSVDKFTKKETVVWQMRPGQADNHLLDSTKLAAIGLYEQGARDSIDNQPTGSRRRGGGWSAL